jgi:hypothetical protein
LEIKAGARFASFILQEKVNPQLKLRCLWLAFFTPALVTANLVSFLSGIALRPNLVGNPLRPSGERTIDRWFNTEAVRLPTPDRPFGNAGRDAGRGPAVYQFDLG